MPSIGALLAAKLDVAVVELTLVAGEPRLATEVLPPHPACFYCRAGHPLHAEQRPDRSSASWFPLWARGCRRGSRRASSSSRRAGSIDRDTGDYLPPIKVDSIRMAKDVVLAAMRSRWRRCPSSPTRSLPESSSRSAARAAWMQTGYGFVTLRGTALSPAAEAFKDEMRRVEDEIAAAERRTNGARGYCAEAGPNARLDTRGDPSGRHAHILEPRQSYCLLISTRRASASPPAVPTSTNIGGFVSRFASATPAALSASRTAMARLLASSSFFATSPVLSV